MWQQQQCDFVAAHLPADLAQLSISFLKPQKPWRYRHQGMCGDWAQCMGYTSMGAIQECAHGAAQGGCIELLEALLEKGPDSFYILSFAAKNGSWSHFQQVRKLLRQKKRLRIAPTLLYHCARGGNARLWKWCADRYFETLYNNERGYNDPQDDPAPRGMGSNVHPVLGALRSGHFQLARDIQAWFHFNVISWKDKTSIPERFAAVCRRGDVSMARRMIRENKVPEDDVRLEDKQKCVFFGDHYSEHEAPTFCQFLSAACRSGNEMLVRTLLSHMTKKGCDLSFFAAILLTEAASSGTESLLQYIHETVAQNRSLYAMNDGSSCANTMVERIIHCRNTSALRWFLQNSNAEPTYARKTQKTILFAMREAIDNGWIDAVIFIRPSCLFASLTDKECWMKGAIMNGHVKIVECLFQWFEDVYDIEDCFDTAVRYEQLRIMDFFEPKTMPGDWYKIYSLQESVQHIYALEHILLHYERVTRKQLWLCCALGRLCECIQKTMTIFPNSESRGCRQQTNMRTLSLLIQRMCICTSDSNEGRYSCPRNQRPDGSYAFVWQQFVCHSHLQVCKSCLKLHDELMLQKIKV